MNTTEQQQLQLASTTANSPTQQTAPTGDLIQWGIAPHGEARRQQQKKRVAASGAKKTVLPWSTKVDALRRFRDLEGECNVPQAYVDPETGFRLGRWVANIRQRMDFLSTEQVEDLNELGFVWTRYRVMPWNVKYDLLAQYKEANGDTLVSKDYVCPKTQFRLGGWVDRLRQTKSNLNAARIAELDRLGFVWNAYENHWESMFDLLCEYKKEHGHVSPRSREQYQNKPLGQWVAVQRSIWSRHQKKKQKQAQSGRKSNSNDAWNSTTQERQQRLEAIGFCWNVRKQLTSSHFATLIAARKQKSANQTAATVSNDEGASQDDELQESNSTGASSAQISRNVFGASGSMPTPLPTPLRMDKPLDGVVRQDNSLHQMVTGFLPHHSTSSNAMVASDALLGDRAAARMRAHSVSSFAPDGVIPAPALSSASSMFFAQNNNNGSSPLLAATAAPPSALHHQAIPAQAPSASNLLMPSAARFNPALLASTLQATEPLYGNSSRASSFLGLPSASEHEALLQRCEQLEARTAAITNQMQQQCPPLYQTQAQDQQALRHMFLS